MTDIISLSDSAIVKIKDLIAEENNPNIKLRIFVQGGGCSGCGDAGPADGLRCRM